MVQTIIAAISSFLIGLSKSGIAGVSTLSVPLMAEAFGAKISVGLVLPILITGDIMALIFYRKFARWKYILIVIPYALLGIVIGYLILDDISEPVLKKSMGILIIFLVGGKTDIAVL